MEIKLQKLVFNYFKGTKNFTFQPDCNNVSVYGDNQTGKTTLFDGWGWLLFGKNSQDQNDFNIKTLENGEPIHKIEHQITGFISIDNEEHELKRTYKEVWKTERAEEELKLKGHTTNFFFDSPMGREMDYKAKIDSFIKEDIFKLITNPMYFNSLPWEKRRAILIKIAGEVSNEDVAKNKKTFEDILVVIGTKTFDEFRKQLSAKKTEIKKLKDGIPVRIDEVNKQMPIEPDYDQVFRDIEETTLLVEQYDNQIFNKSEALKVQLEELNLRQKNIHELKTKLISIEFEVSSKNKASANNKEFELQSLRQKLEYGVKEYESLTKRIESHKARIEELNTSVNILIEKWDTLNCSEFILNPDQEICPTCKKPLEASVLATRETSLRVNFNTDKKSKLDSITKEGKLIREDIAKYEFQVKQDTEKVIETYRTIEDYKLSIESFIAPESVVQPIDAKTLPKYIQIESHIIELESLPVPEKPDDKEIKDKRIGANRKLEELRNKNKIKDTIKTLQKRITELNEEDKKLAQEMANLEKYEFTLDQFEKVKMNSLEEKVNRIFKFVQFRLFKPLMNGGYESCCDTLVDGIPWNDVNTGARINGGISIINVLSEFYNTYAPIWIDQSEAVTKLIPTKSQLIRLVVSEPDKSLRVEIDN